jgi:excisionase family DNA binding protein
VSDLARALLADLAGDDVALDRLADALADRVAARLAPAREGPDGLRTVATAAEVLGCHPRTVRRRIADGSLPAVVEHGRLMIRAGDLRAYLEGLERAGPRPPARRGRARRDLGLDFLRQ